MKQLSGLLHVFTIGSGHVVSHLPNSKLEDFWILTSYLDMANLNVLDVSEVVDMVLVYFDVWILISGAPHDVDATRHDTHQAILFVLDSADLFFGKNLRKLDSQILKLIQVFACSVWKPISTILLNLFQKYALYQK